MTFLVGIIVSFIVLLIHYEMLNLVTNFIDKEKKRNRREMIFIVSVIVAAHLIEAVVFALMFYIRKDLLELDIFNNGQNLSPLEYYNFSLENYTSLGYGDVFIQGGGGRFLSAMESVVGLILIGWSSSFMFLIMTWDWEKRLNNKVIKGNR